LWANAEVYWALAKDSWYASNWLDKLRIWLKPPGWRPPDVAARFPKTPFDITQVQTFHPPLSRAVMWFGALQFGLLLLGSATHMAAR
jgi:alkylglycerol monooxygenase